MLLQTLHLAMPEGGLAAVSQTDDGLAPVVGC